MAFTFKPAVRENVALLIGLAGGTGSGKTYSAMRLAAGISGNKPFCLIDTEAGRGKHYADQFKFDHGDLMPPFRPDAYIEAIKAADAAGYPVIVVDSMTHVWAGDGGCLDWHDQIVDEAVERQRKFAESKGWQFDEFKTRSAQNISAWIEPKMGHKHMVAKLLQIRAHLILCFRAEEKIEIVKDEGKTKIVAKESPTGLYGWIPVCEKNLPFELTASFLLTADAPGMPKPIKLQQQHRALFPLDKPINEESGRLVAEWARGGSAKAAAAKPSDQDDRDMGLVAAKTGATVAERVTSLNKWWADLGERKSAALKKYRDETLAPIAKAETAPEGEEF